mgnify:CR=1 FL=1
MHSFFAGAISGIVEVTCTHPIDYMKTMKQQNYSLRHIISNTPFSKFTLTNSRIFTEKKIKLDTTGMVAELCKR